MAIRGRVEGSANLVARLRNAPASLRPALMKPVRDEARLFVNQAVRITPPASAGVTGNKAKAQGEGAVARDIRQVYASAPAAYGIIAAKDPGMAAAFYRAMLQGEISVAEAILARSGSRWRNVDVGYFDPALHARARTRRGRVTRHVPMQITIDWKKLDAYIKKKQKNVGLLGAGFNQAALDLRASVPTWMRRHGAQRNGIQVITTLRDFTIVIRNTTPFARGAGMQGRMDYVHKYRLNALERRLAAELRRARL